MSRDNYLNSRANLKAVRVPDRPDYLRKTIDTWVQDFFFFFFRFYQ
jgi:hypothetical protein